MTIALLLGVLTLSSFGMLLPSKWQSKFSFATASPQDELKPKDIEENEDEREREFLRRRLTSNKPVSHDAYDKGLEEWNRLPRIAPRKDRAGKRTGQQNATATSLLGTVWRPAGPSPLQLGTGLVNGRVHAIAVNPNNPNVIYQGVNIGGLWKSVDGGANWTSLFDQQAALGIGQPSAIAIDPNNTNTVYVGTNSRFQLSKGILKSSDGGASWIVLGSGYPAGNNGNTLTLFQGQNVNGMVVEPTNSNLIYLATSAGLFRSTDGGQMWTAGTGTNANGNAQSLVLDTSSPTGSRVLFAGVSGAGILRSNDGGMNWTPALT
ncbi:MAG: sialidase family protein, partial [Blastocatellia bacterium]